MVALINPGLTIRDTPGTKEKFNFQRWAQREA